MSNLSQFKITKLVFWVGLCLALIGSLVSLAGRYRVEQSNKATGIAVEIQPVIDLGNAQGLTLAESLKHLSQQGLTYLTINEETAAEYFATGQLRLQNNWQPQIWGEKKLIRRLADAAELRTGTRPTTGAIPDGPDILELGDRPLDFYRNLNIGLDPEQCAAAKSAKLRIIARLSNPVGVNPGYIEGVLTRAAKQGGQHPASRPRIASAQTDRSDPSTDIARISGLIRGEYW